jgi:hypothetical protein
MDFFRGTGFLYGQFCFSLRFCLELFSKAKKTFEKTIGNLFWPTFAASNQTIQMFNTQNTLINENNAFCVGRASSLCRMHDKNGTTTD